MCFLYQKNDNGMSYQRLVTFIADYKQIEAALLFTASQRHEYFSIYKYNALWLSETR